MKKEIIVAFYHKIPKEYPLIDTMKLKLIKLWTKSKYYHVEAIVDNKWIEATTNGLKINPLRKFDPDIDYMIVQQEVCPSQEKIIDDWILSLEGSPYDWKAIWYSQFINLGKQNKNAWMCSEITNKILQLFLVKPFIRFESSDINPGQIYRNLQINGKKITADELNKKFNF